MDQTQTQRKPNNYFLFHPYCAFIITLLFPALTIPQIGIGAAYLQDCPLQPYIPVYVLVCGVFSVVLALLFWARNMEEGDKTTLSRIYMQLIFLVSTFMFCWIICGSGWIYTIYPPNYNQTVAGEPYCNKTLYQFAFLTTTLGNILLGLALLIGCCINIWAVREVTKN